MESSEYIAPPKTDRKTQLNSRRIARYRLKILQHPVRARCCGFGEKDRRPLDPPPIVELVAEDINGVQLSLNPADTILLVAQCELFSQDKQTNQTLVYAPWTMQSFCEISNTTARKPEHIRNLIGATVSNVYHLNNEHNAPGTYFIFHDLSVRTEGTFTLKFTFVNIGDCQGNTDNESFTQSTVNEEVFTEPFSVYSAKKFPGLTESTPLSKCFSKQGIKIPIRNDTFRRPITTTAMSTTSTIAVAAAADVTALASVSSSSSSPSSPYLNMAPMIANIIDVEPTTPPTSQPERAHSYTRLPISDFLIPEQ